MPNVKRADLEALRNMVSQAHWIVSTEPLIAGGIERARELLATAENLADFLLSLDVPVDQSRMRTPRRSQNGR